MALIQYLTRIQFAFGAVAELAGELKRLEIERPLLITDAGVRDAGLVDRLLAQLDEPSAIFDETPSNPSEAAVLNALDVYRTKGCDGLIALGGGSCTDLAKAVGLLASHGGALADYQIKGGGSDRIGKIAPVVAVPTAAGTGAEVGRAASITLTDGRKVAAVNMNLVPQAVICDPELTVTLPPGLTASTGMDALSHGIEAYLSSRYNPPAGAIAKECVRLAAATLERAVANGGDRDARSDMMMAALMGGMTFQKGLGAVHALSHPLGELSLHHGTLNAVLLPHVLHFNRPAADARIGELAEAAGLDRGDDLAGWITDLNRRTGLPGRLAEMGVRDADIPAIAERAALDHLMETNPRKATPRDCADILRAAL